MATPKGLKSGFSIALLLGDKPAPIHLVSRVLGHSDIATTGIYLEAIGQKKAVDNADVRVMTTNRVGRPPIKDKKTNKILKLSILGLPITHK